MRRLTHFSYESYPEDDTNVSWVNREARLDDVVSRVTPSDLSPSPHSSSVRGLPQASRQSWDPGPKHNPTLRALLFPAQVWVLTFFPPHNSGSYHTLQVLGGVVSHTANASEEAHYSDLYPVLCRTFVVKLWSWAFILSGTADLSTWPACVTLKPRRLSPTEPADRT